MILDEILASTRQRLAVARTERSYAAVAEAAGAAPPARALADRLRRPGRVSCLAEIKRRSPSAGWIRRDADAAAIARDYETAGADALSVLTDAPFFGGSLADLTAARTAVDVPVLRKDFMLDPYQVVEARAAGADAILVIVRALDDQDLARLLAAAADWGMDVLVEAHDEPEVRRALALGARIVGLNQRDLATFRVDLDLAVRLRPLIPPDVVLVAESGIATRAEVTRLHQAGIDAILVGESLMRAPEPGLALRGLLGVD